MSAPDRFTISNELIQAYSRRGNFHTDAEHSIRLGLPGLVAQGTQATGRAYGLLLQAWGEDFLAFGEVDLKFVGMVIGGNEIETTVNFEADGDQANVEVRIASSDRTAVIGTARRR